MGIHSHKWIRNIIMTEILLLIVGVGFSIYRKKEEVAIPKKLAQGEEYYIQKDYPKARETYIEVLALDDSNAKAIKKAAVLYTDWGEELIEEKKYEEAQAVIQEGYEITGDDELQDMIAELKNQGIWAETTTTIPGIPIDQEKIAEGGYPEFVEQVMNLADQVGDSLDALLTQLH